MKADEGPRAQSWGTPQTLVDELAGRFAGGKFNLDPCAEPWNEKAFYSFCGSPEDDGLIREWRVPAKTTRVFCNPPYNDVKSWVEKAITEVELGNAAVVVMLLPNRTDQSWFHAFAESYVCESVHFIKGRVQFDAPPEVTASSNREGSIVVVLRKPLLAKDYR